MNMLKNMLKLVVTWLVVDVSYITYCMKEDDINYCFMLRINHSLDLQSKI